MISHFKTKFAQFVTIIIVYLVCQNIMANVLWGSRYWNKESLKDKFRGEPKDGSQSEMDRNTNGLTNETRKENEILVRNHDF